MHYPAGITPRPPEIQEVALTFISGVQQKQEICWQDKMFHITIVWPMPVQGCQLILILLILVIVSAALENNQE